MGDFRTRVQKQRKKLTKLAVVVTEWFFCSQKDKTFKSIYNCCFFRFLQLFFSLMGKHKMTGGEGLSFKRMAVKQLKGIIRHVWVYGCRCTGGEYNWIHRRPHSVPSIVLIVVLLCFADTVLWLLKEKQNRNIVCTCSVACSTTCRFKTINAAYWTTLA